MHEIILQTKNLTKSYKKRKVVDSLNLEIYRGDIYGFLGPNGAGKSTTLRMIFNLVFPDNGEIEVFNHSVIKKRFSALKDVGGVIEKSDFYLYLSGYKNLEILNSISGKKDKSRIMEVLDLVGLKSRAFDKVKTYSHGMKQRLGIAQALVAKPKLIILDEPTNGLDPQGMKEIRELIKNLSIAENITVLISSHLLHEIEQIANRMAIINEGKLIVQGNVSDILNSENCKYYFKVDDIAKAIHILENKFSAKQIISKDDGIESLINIKQISEINKCFIENEINVYAIIPRQSLENYFLSVIQNN
jgi:ABC-2 type transport system ATP-binding protein